MAIDGATGEVIVDPNEAEISEYAGKRKAFEEQKILLHQYLTRRL